MSKKYRIIYADPPWSYPKTGGTKNSRGMAKQFYSTMQPQEIKALDVGSISDSNSILFLWATYPKLPEALELMKEWGFEYFSVAFTWVKKTKRGKDFFGMGYWTRANPEVCLLGIKGKMKPQSHSIRQLIYSEVGEHSSKPAEVRERIVELCGDLPRIELFARDKEDGWDVWGDEVDSDIELTERE